MCIVHISLMATVFMKLISMTTQTVVIGALGFLFIVLQDVLPVNGTRLVQRGDFLVSVDMRLLIL